MAFSGSTDFSYTRDQLIKAALRKCRAYDADGGAPEPYQVRDAAETLNLLLKSLQTQGVLLWVQEDIELSLVKGKQTYTIGPSGYLDRSRPLRAYSFRRRDISTKEDTQITQYSKSDYAALTNKSDTGVPTIAYYERSITQGNISVWPVPDNSKYKLIFTVDSQLQDFDASGDTAHMPSYAYNYFVWALAAELGSEYGLPLDEISLFEQKASIYKADLLDFEEEEDGFQIVPAWHPYEGSW